MKKFLSIALLLGIVFVFNCKKETEPVVDTNTKPAETVTETTATTDPNSNITEDNAEQEADKLLQEIENL
jgi:hypothetical protein